ncbi:MAG: DNA polymerase IV [Pikeienuella sp.]
MYGFCRDCLEIVSDARRCPACSSPRILRHAELTTLGVAHLDCDCFYAAVEKRDDPSLADKPVIIGGGHRGVVSTACYIARIQGVRSAMPMFKALEACPEAVVIRPRMEAYVAASKEIRALMKEVTPIVEPLSLDEAFMDLRGTERLHKAIPALVMARLVKRIQGEVGVSTSVGLSHNKFLAKVASDLDKPRGFSIIGQAETLDFLADQPVSLIWGVGASLKAKLHSDGLRKIGDLRAVPVDQLMARYGSMGKRLSELSMGRDLRQISSESAMKSVSAETTFNQDIADKELLEAHLWRLAVRVSDRAKAKEISGRTVTLKLKSSSFKQASRQTALSAPTQLADAIFQTARAMLPLVIDKGPFRLIGVGIADLIAEDGVVATDLFDPNAQTRADAERATDKIRQKFGTDAIIKGRSLK